MKADSVLMYVSCLNGNLAATVPSSKYLPWNEWNPAALIYLGSMVSGFTAWVIRNEYRMIYTDEGY